MSFLEFMLAIWIQIDSDASLISSFRSLLLSNRTTDSMAFSRNNVHNFMKAQLCAHENLGSAE
jgi:hypothetical protein